MGGKKERSRWTAVNRKVKRCLFVTLPISFSDAPNFRLFHRSAPWCPTPRILFAARNLSAPCSQLDPPVQRQVTFGLRWCHLSGKSPALEKSPSPPQHNLDKPPFNRFLQQVRHDLHEWPLTAPVRMLIVSKIENSWKQCVVKFFAFSLLCRLTNHCQFLN